MKKFNPILQVLSCLSAVAFVVWLRKGPEDSFWEMFMISLVTTAIISLCIFGVKWLIRHIPSSGQTKAMLKPIKHGALLIASGGLTILEIIGIKDAIEKGCETKTMVILIAGLILFASSFIYLIIYIFGRKKAPQYDTDQHYLYLLFGMSKSEIEWKHITHFSLSHWDEMYENDVIVVNIDNNDDVLANAKNLIIRKGIKMNIEKFGSPYFLPTDRCILSPQEVCDELEKELKKHKPNS